jgi:hypothetical protein
MTTNKLLLGALLATAFLPALAAELPADSDAPQDKPAVRTRERFHVEVAHNGPRKTVKNAPYSAEMVNERVQVLADGNQIVHKTTTMSYRDSAGRTRHEIRNSEGELASIAIQDPVENVTWMLRPKDKTAVKLRPFEFGNAAFSAHLAAEGHAAAEAGRAAALAGRAAGEAARARIEQMRKDGTMPTVERRVTANGEEIVIKRIQKVNEDGKNPEVRHETRIDLSPLADAFGDKKWSANTTQKDLGTRDFGGVKAQGRLRSYEIPANAIGNRNPILVSDEQWFAPDLQVTVYTKHNDPRSGEVTYRLDNIKRDEPQAALFTVPSDYTVKDLAKITHPPAADKQ